MGRPEAISELHRQLISPKSLQGFVAGSPINLFRLFDQTGFSYKGQITSGFGERGLKASVGVSIDFGDLVLPGLLSAKLQGGVDLSLSRHTMLVVVRQPMQLNFAFRSWNSCVPLCLCVLSGHAAEATLKVATSASAGRWSDVDELGLKLSISADASIGGQVLDLSDPCPLHYPPSASEGTLARDFAHALDTLTRHQVKNMVTAWLKDKEKTAEVPDEVKEFVSEQLDLERRREQAQEKAQEQAEEAKTTAEAWAEEHVPQFDKLQKLAKTGVFGRVWAWLTPPKSTDLLQRLDELEQLLKDDHSSTDEAREQTQLTQQQITLFRAQIKSLQLRKLTGPDDDPHAATRRGPPTPSRLCHLHVFVQRRQAGAQAAANLGLQLLGAGVKAEASANYTRSARLVSYRFQQLAMGKTPLVITQDTALVFRDVDAKAAASFNASLKLPEEDKERSLDRAGDKTLLGYRTMTCRSAVVYWQPPAARQDTSIVPGTGSGVSFGFGVQASRLVQVAKEAAWRARGESQDLSADSTVLLARMAEQLRLPSARIEQFLVAANIGGDDPDRYVAEVVWLEAGFALPLTQTREGALKPFRLPASFLGGGHRLPDLLADTSLGGAMASPQTLSAQGLMLNVVRLRYRLSDARDRTQTAFKLGFSYVLGIDIAVDKLRTSGHEGVIDLFTWFADEHANEPAQQLQGHEHAVPPVAFLHQ